MAVDNALLPGLGGPMGRHAQPQGFWFKPLRWALAAAALLYLVLLLRHLPCLQVRADNPINAYIRACYSDLQVTFLGQGYAYGASALGGEQLAEAPLVVLSWAVTLFLLGIAGYQLGPAITPQQAVDASVAFTALQTVMLGLSFLGAVVCLTWLGHPAQRHGTWRVLWFAASPLVLAAGLVSWTLMPLALTALGLLLFARRRTVEAGLVLGLAASAGTMPIAVLLAVAVAAGLRGGLRPLLRLVGPAVAMFIVVHLPLLLAGFDRVYAYYHAEINKSVSYGSLWYLLEQLGIKALSLGSFTFTVLLMLFLGVLLGYLYVTGRTPRVGQLVAVVVLAVCVLGPAFTPQTGLWVLFVVLLASPHRLELVAVTLTQTLYCAAVWGWLGGGLTSAQSGPFLLYWLAILGHIAVQLGLLAQILIELARPQRDRLRRLDGIDLLGGELPDVALSVRLPVPAVPEVAAPRRSADPV